MMKLFRELKQRANLAWRILCDFDGHLEAYAERELRAAGYFDGDEMNGWMAQGVVDMVRVFSLQGHSGGSASSALQLFDVLARHKPIGPLTGADSEWVDVAEQSGRPLWQNKRCGHVFKNGDGLAYDLDAVIFEEPSGARFTSHHSRQFITFPYTPRSVVARVSVDATESDKRLAAQAAWSAA
jgi:hypothetical protein